jgi:hypothetical protein
MAITNPAELQTRHSVREARRSILTAESLDVNTVDQFSIIKSATIDPDGTIRSCGIVGITPVTYGTGFRMCKREVL